MKQSFFSKLILTAVMALSLGLAACAKKGDSSVRVAGRGGVVANGTTNNATCNNGSQGNVTFTPANSQMVLTFVSATIDPASFGSICRVNMTSNLSFDSNGYLQAGSSLLLQVVDSYVGTQYNGHTIQPYEIQFANAVSGAQVKKIITRAPKLVNIVPEN